jgi:DNA (cytosine-5)-methyltransferase 1
VCAGIGGLAEGVANGGLEHLLLLDASTTCEKLLRHRRKWKPDRVHRGDVRTFDFSSLRGQVGLLSGGPPCQPWSQSGLHGGFADARDLLGIMPDVVAIVQPEVFLFENVPGLAMSADGQYLQSLVAKFRRPAQRLQYGVLVGMFNAADYGVPQIRKRVFILGLRDLPGAAASLCFDKLALSATHRDPSSAANGLHPWIAVGEALQGREDPGGWRRWIGGMSD